MYGLSTRCHICYTEGMWYLASLRMLNREKHKEVTQNLETGVVVKGF